LVLAHARALLTSTPEGVCDYIDGDLRDLEAILAEAARTLDFGQPVALMLLGVLHHIPDTSEAQEIMRRHEIGRGAMKVQVKDAGKFMPGRGG
jgi:S-adenosyl methyltransferase